MEHAEIRFRMAKPVARERARDSFRRGHSGIDDKDVDAANQSGRDHLSPFGLVTVHAWRANAER